MTREIRTAEALAACAARLGTGFDDDGPGPETEQVRRLLLHVADDIGHHCALLRRLDDEIDLLSRRRVASADLTELRRRRARTQAALDAAIDGATRSLVPGGDALDPATILRRLTGGQARSYAYFGRPAPDRGMRLRRLSAHLLRGRPARSGAPVPPERRPGEVVVPLRSVRLARIRRLLAATCTDRPTPGARS